MRGKGGFALVGAVFVLVVLSLMGSFMVKLSGVQTRTGLFALEGARAYHAARSGIEWGIYQAAVASSCEPSTGLTVEGFNVVVGCVDQGEFTEGADTYNIYRLTSSAQRGTYGAIDYVSRTLTADVAGP